MDQAPTIAPREISVAEMEKHILRFQELGNRESTFAPAEMLLPKYQRKRYVMVGRPSEQPDDEKLVGEVDVFNLNYHECEPGKGLALHAHEESEVFIPLSGRWEFQFGSEGTNSIVVDAWDVISIPPNVMHCITNVGEQKAFLIALLPGQDGAAIYYASKVINEFQAAGVPIQNSQIPPRSGSADAA